MRVILLCLSLFSGWREGGVPVCEAPGAQWILDVKGTDDGRVVVLWWDSDEGVKNSFIQVVDSAGNLVFEEPVKVTEDLGYGGEVEVDREGNYWVVLTKARDGDVDVWIQKISPDGRRLFGDEGKVVCDVDGDQRRPHLCISGDGVYVVWEDARDYDSLWYDVYIQKVSADGEVLWNKEGIPVANWEYNQKGGNLVGLGDGSVICGFVSSDGVHLQKIDDLGNKVWGDSGIVIEGGRIGFCMEEVSMVKTDAQEVIVFYLKKNYSDLYCQKIDKDGDFLWGDSGVFITSHPVDEFSYSEVGDDGVYCIWNDEGSYTYWVNLITSDGEVKFGEGIKVWQQYYRMRWLSKPSVTYLDIGSNGIMVFESDKYDTLYPYEAYINRVNGSGELWGEKKRLTDVPGGMYRVISASDGAIIVWVDCRNGDADIYAGKIDTLGNWVTGVKEREDVYRISFPLWFKDELEVKFLGGGLVEVYDIGGRKVREMRGSGRMIWDGRDFNGKELPCGVYFIRIISDFGEYKGKVIKAR